MSGADGMSPGDDTARDWQTQRIDSLAEDVREVKVELVRLWTRMDEHERSAERRHGETQVLMGRLVDHVLEEQDAEQAARKARQDRWDRCLAFAERIIERFAGDPKLRLLVGVGGLILLLAGTGLGLTVADWLSITPTKGAP